MTPREGELEGFKRYFLCCLWRAYGRLWLIIVAVSFIILLYSLLDPESFAFSFPCWYSEGQLFDPPWVTNPHYIDPCTQGQVPWMLWATVVVAGATVAFYGGKWLQAIGNRLSLKLWGSKPL